MQRILNALLQFRNPILYFFLLAFSVSFSINQSPFHQYSFQKYGFYLSSRLYHLKNALESYYNLKIINQQLLKENEQLKEIQLSLGGLSLYPSDFKEPKRFPFKVKRASVLKNSYKNQRNFLILNIGSDNGIQPEMGVISKDGIIGVVHSVSKNYSNVISILNKDLKINVRTKKSPAFGSLVWSGVSPFEFKIEDIVSNAKLSQGDTLITGGMSSYFPLGIPIGKISKLNKTQGSGYYSVDAILFNDPSQIYYAYVIENLDFKEIKSLQKNISQ
tara:strand:+ start:2929 stop:3750 length:822 start_codon:yes stop_codon:yes gene_type:complete